MFPTREAFLLKVKHVLSLGHKATGGLQWALMEVLRGRLSVENAQLPAVANSIMEMSVESGVKPDRIHYNTWASILARRGGDLKAAISGFRRG